jgi:hypothetical protein
MPASEDQALAEITKVTKQTPQNRHDDEATDMNCSLLSHFRVAWQSKLTPQKLS